jgi:hypothetical protein
VRSIHEGVVVLGLTVADLARAATDRAAPPHWPGGPCQAPPRRPSEPATRDDAVALMAAVSRMYVADRLSLTALEQALEQVLSSDSCADLDAIAVELLATDAS